MGHNCKESCYISWRDKLPGYLCKEKFYMSQQKGGAGHMNSLFSYISHCWKNIKIYFTWEWRYVLITSYQCTERRGFYNNLSSDSFGEEKAYERITTNQWRTIASSRWKNYLCSQWKPGEMVSQWWSHTDVYSKETQRICTAAGIQKILIGKTDRV